MSPTVRECFADAALLMVACIWGATFIIVKEAVEATPVFSFLFMRFGLGGGLLFLICLPRMHRISRQVIRDGCLLGVVLFLVFAFQTFGLTTTPASVTAFITGLYVVFVPLILSVLRLKPPSGIVQTSVFLSAVGLALVTLQNKISMTRGELLVLICAVFCAIHILLTGRFSRRNDIFLLTLIQVCVVSLLSLVFSYVFDPRVVPMTFSSRLITALVVTGVFATVVAFGVQTGAQKFTTPTKTAVIFSMEPVSAAFFGYVMGEAPLGLRQYAGAGLIFFAMILTELGTAGSGEEETS